MTGIPKSFKKLATSPTMDGIKKLIATYYGGESKTLVPRDGTSDQWEVFSSTIPGKSCGTFVIETPRGFYFGRIEA